MKWMSWKKHISRSAAALTGIALALFVCAATAFAYGRINTDAQTSLTAVLATQETKAMKDVGFRLYKVADVSDAAVFTAATKFADAAVSLNDVESVGAWADMAATLLAYADAGGVAADFTGTTDADGRVSFSGLTVGLYLLAGDTAVVNDYSYTPTPTMIMLPTLLEDDTWEYDPVVDVKVTRSFLTEYQDITVKKVWENKGRTEYPDSVELELLRDGQVQETITLNVANNWSFTWKDLPGTYEGADGTKAYTYTVNEKQVPAGYSVSVSRNGSSFTVTNTYQEETTEDKPSDHKPSGDNSSGDQTSGDPAPASAGRSLPQTGVLNWPVPVLTVAGLLLVGMGWYLYTRKKEN